MRINVFGFLGDGGGRSPVDRYVEHARRLRDEGFTRLWTAQLAHEPDLLMTMAVAAREVDGIEFATGVLPIQVQHPMLLAQRALTANLIADVLDDPHNPATVERVRAQVAELTARFPVYG